MSRARRLPRHRRHPAVTKATVPVALGGAVAAVALTASPLADALHRDGQAGRSGDDSPEVVMVAPATATPQRASSGPAGPGLGAPASSAPLIRLYRSSGTSPDSSGSDGSAETAQPTPEGSPSTEATPSTEHSNASSHGNGSPPTAPPGQDPTHRPVPLPTLSNTSLPTLLPTLTPTPLP